jgi:hypothetical protein
MLFPIFKMRVLNYANYTIGYMLYIIGQIYKKNVIYLILWQNIFRGLALAHPRFLTRVHYTRMAFQTRLVF